MTETHHEWDFIYQYTRKQALDDGVLVEVSDTAKEAGFRFPTAVTETVWNMITTIPQKAQHQDIDGRLWDVVYMARVAAQRKANQEKHEILFPVILLTSENVEKGRTHPEHAEITLKLHIGPGDEGEPVLTIMLPEED